MKFNLISSIIIFTILLSIGFTAQEFNGSLIHYLIVFGVALLLAIFGGLG